ERFGGRGARPTGPHRRPGDRPGSRRRGGIAPAPLTLSEPLLFSPLRLRGVSLRNRAVLSPMCQYQAVEGRMQDWHFAHHARFAAGGPRAPFVQATGVTPGGRIPPGCTGILDDGHVPGLERIARAYRRYGPTPRIQI